MSRSGSTRKPLRGATKPLRSAAPAERASRDVAPSPELSTRSWIGISGWSYAPWRGIFYPVGLRQADELAFASRQFNSIEVNGSFYSLLRPEACQSWFDATPEDFVFALKGSRYITHLKRLKDAEVALANFFASGLLRLGHKLGPILWQLPPRFAFDPERLREFFELLPRTTGQAAALAARHDARLIGRSDTQLRCDLPMRHALEVRHASFSSPEYVALLREYGIGSCVADAAGLYPLIEDLTADFVYVRLHGADQLYVSGYEPKALQTWAERVNAWRRGETPPAARLLAKPAARRAGVDVYAYFDNDVKVRAPFDAANLQRLVKGEAHQRRHQPASAISEEPRTEWAAWQRRAPRSRRAT